MAADAAKKVAEAKKAAAKKKKGADARSATEMEEAIGGTTEL